MATNSLLIGPINTLEEDVVYALPARAVTVYSDVLLEVSNTTAFTSSSTISADTPTKTSAAFVRSTTGDALVTVKAD